MAKPVAQTLHVRRASPNPSGLARPENIAARTIGEACRAAHSAHELQEMLWSIFAGVDPFAAAREVPNPDNLPMPAPVPVDWQHRMKAGELWANYAHGKPLQGVVVDAQIQQQTTVVTTSLGPIDPRALSPEVRAALRVVAEAAVGRVSSAAPATTRVLDVRVNTQHVSSEPREQPAAHADHGATVVNLDDVSGFDVDGLPLEGAPAGRLKLGVEAVVDRVAVGEHAANVPSDQTDVKLDFRDSTNLVDAVLSGGILTVRFRGPDGTAARTYRYHNVTEQMMSQWRAAPSAGAWFQREIRQQHARYPQVGSRSAVATRGGMVL
jgi:hypothetical protein